jgi:hypothetical protein
VLDAIYCSEMGLPSTVLITTPFQTLARKTAGNVGQPDFVVQVVEHPVWTRDDAWIAAAAGKLVEPIRQTLLATRAATESAARAG